MVGSPETILEVHRKILQPQIFTSEVDNISDVQSISSLGKKYDWYPNNELETPMKVYT